jgi:hypothetical protein
MQKLSIVGSANKNGRGFANCDPKTVYGAQNIAAQTLSVGEGVVRSEVVEHSFGDQVDEHVVMLDALLGRLQQIGVVLNPLDHSREPAQLPAIAEPCRAGRGRDVFDKLCGKGRRWGSVEGDIGRVSQ